MGFFGNIAYDFFQTITKRLPAVGASLGRVWFLKVALPIWPLAFSP